MKEYITTKDMPGGWIRCTTSNGFRFIKASSIEFVSDKRNGECLVTLSSGAQFYLSIKADEFMAHVMVARQKEIIEQREYISSPHVTTGYWDTTAIYSGTD